MGYGYGGGDPATQAMADAEENRRRAIAGALAPTGDMPGGPGGPPPGQPPANAANPAPATAPPATGAPAAGASTGSFVPGGWDATKWNDPNKHDLKYDAGHLLAGVSRNGKIRPEDVKPILPQLQAMGIQWDGGDGLTFPDGNHVDFIKGMKAGGGEGDLNWLDSTMMGGQPGTNGFKGNYQGGQGAAVQGALSGAGGAYAPNFAGNAPFAGTQWLQQLLAGLGVKI